MSRRKQLAIGAALVAVLLSLWGLNVVLGERFMVVIDRERRKPLLLRFGDRVAVGRCLIRETDDPASDVLANQIDVDADGRPDFRLSANLTASHQTCELRRLGFWVDREMKVCHEAANSCGRGQ